MGMGKITTVIPRPVMVRLGSEDYAAGELRLCDLADLQQTIDDQQGDPLGHVRGRLEAEGVEACELELADILEASERVPKVYGEFVPDIGEAVQLKIRFVQVCLQRYHPGMTFGEARRIAANLQPGQYESLQRVAWRTSVAEEVGRLLGTKLRPARGRAIGWPRAVVEVAKEFGYTLEYVYSMTISEFWFCRSDGKERPENDFDSIAEAPRRSAWWEKIWRRRAERAGDV